MGLHPRLEDNGEERWQHLFSVALGGLLANPSMVFGTDHVKYIVDMAKEVADEAVTIKPEQSGSGTTESLQ